VTQISTKDKGQTQSFTALQELRTGTDTKQFSKAVFIIDSMRSWYRKNSSLYLVTDD